jgi:ion channel-forming bestrophin family protein
MFKHLLKLRTNPYFLILKNPTTYLFQIGGNTLIMGAIMLIINIIYIYTSLHTIKIPVGIHSLVGFVIALLLVFRTNTAYERWWEGRKQIANINSKVSYISSLIDSCGLPISDIGIFKQKIKDILSNTKKYLMDNSDMEGNPEFHLKQMKLITENLKLLKVYNNSDKSIVADQDMASFNYNYSSLLDSITACERIKNTPIPFSYYIHIKLSVLLYLITLPFSLLYEFNLWSTPIVMVLYFLIAGIEIISNEIENPFSGEPNDLPIESLINNIDSVVKIQI